MKRSIQTLYKLFILAIAIVGIQVYGPNLVGDESVDNLTSTISHKVPDVAVDASLVSVGDLLVDQPWLNDIFHTSTCLTGDSIAIYRSGSNLYYLVHQGETNALYDSSGIKYCENVTLSLYHEFFYLTDMVHQWTCGDDTPVGEDYSALPIDLAM